MILFVIHNIFILLIILIAGSLESAFAFSIAPNLSASQQSFIPSVAYETENGKSGIITRQPIAYEIISRGGTEDFLKTLRAEFPASMGWKFRAAEHDLQGSFSVSAYYVFFNGKVGGSGFSFDYNPAGNDPVSGSNKELHWIQRIISNHKRNADHGVQEDRIGIKGHSISLYSTPFLDVVPKNAKRKPSPNRSLPPHFEYENGRNDTENDHAWTSETYLVSIDRNDTTTVTIHNGVKWGWENKVNKDSNTTTAN
ncbi:MAG: hypothetical protein V1791_00050 [Pseudomonadota bacterium]